jgi:hypothetical protein
MSQGTRLAAVYSIVQGRDDRNQAIFSVLVKRTYDIRSDGRVVLADNTRPLVKIDQYYDDGNLEWPTVKYETDLASFKVATDVVLIGKAYAPNGKPVPYLDATVEVGARRKTIRATGDRRCFYRANLSPSFSEPVLFTEMPIQYERAYGGQDMRSDPDAPFFYPRNHSGVGVALKNTKETVEGLALPNIEDPEDLLTPDRVVFNEPDRWSGQPLPDGFGWFNRSWYPRCSFTGAFPAYVGIDTILREETLGLVPKGQIALSRQFKLPSFDLRFHSGASRGLAFPFLAGSETFRLTNLTPAGTLAFRLPGEAPSIMLDIGLGENELKPFLHTVCVRLEEKQVDLVWRGAHPYPGLDWLPEMKRLNAEVVWNK